MAYQLTVEDAMGRRNHSALNGAKFSFSSKETKRIFLHSIAHFPEQIGNPRSIDSIPS
jgi:hypothetical protein